MVQNLPVLGLKYLARDTALRKTGVQRFLGVASGVTQRNAKASTLPHRSAHATKILRQPLTGPIMPKSAGG